MRDSYGGAFMFSIVFTFIVLFISFLAITVNYAKVFRIKNGVIDILEQNQYSNDDYRKSAVIDEIDSYLAEFGYTNGGNTGISNHCQDEGGEFTKNGACIVELDASDKRDSSAGIYYRVYVYIVGSIPLLGNNIVMPISGDTDIIYAPDYYEELEV